MASAWGLSFGRAFGNSWGRIDTATAVTGGAASRGGSRRPLVAVIAVDGKDYRVPIDMVQEFVDALKAKIKEAPPPKVLKKRRKSKTVEKVAAPIHIVIKSAPVEYFAQIESIVDRSNEIFNTLWQRAIQKYLLQLDDEEAILLLIH